MNVPTAPDQWTPEQATEAMLHLAVEAAPEWAEQAWLLAIVARDAAPPGEESSWIQTTADAFTRDYAALCERIVADARATPDQVNRFAHEIAAAMTVRFAQLKAGTVQTGGQA